MAKPRALTPEQEQEIAAAARLRRTLSNKALAAKFGVATGTVVAIIARSRGIVRRQRRPAGPLS